MKKPSNLDDEELQSLTKDVIVSFGFLFIDIVSLTFIPDYLCVGTY